MEPDGVRGKVVGLPVEFLGDDADVAVVDAVVTEVTGNFLDAEEVWLGLQYTVHMAPEVALRPVGGWRFSVQHGLEALDNGLVVDEDVDRSFCGGDEVQDGQRFSALGVLGKPVDAGGVVEPMLAAVVDAEGGAGEERDSLV